MIGYVTLGTNDLPRACAYYDDLLGSIGASRFNESERYVYWAKRPGTPMIAIMKPYNGEPATVGNGVMVALGVRSKEQVHAVHARALSLGSPDEGAPGSRGGKFYGGYFRDLDGNKLCVFTFGASAE